ncbi:MAG: hypothetical protein N2316_05405 [Spirochaetes bacterium]|nr:hypothetical protein [Spirochaetota bacterium]
MSDSSSKKNLIYKGLAITFSIMFFSLLFAQMIYNKRVHMLDEGIGHLRNEINEEKLFLAFSDQFATDVSICKTFETYMQGLSNKVYHTGKNIERVYEEEHNLEKFKLIQREWVYLNIELWLRLLKYNKLCANKRNYVLYFYPYDCNECAPYANILNKLNKQYGDELWLFSIPAEIDLKIVSIIKNYFNIKDLPAVVINGKLIKGDNVPALIEKTITRNLKRK